MLGVFLLFPTWPGGIPRSSAQPLLSGIDVPAVAVLEGEMGCLSGGFFHWLYSTPVVRAPCLSQEGGLAEPLVPGGVGCGCEQQASALWGSVG